MMKSFKPLIGPTNKVYIDDIVFKSKTRAKHVQHLEEAFGLMQKYNMNPNPLKYVFGVSTSKFLGFMVFQRGIEVNLTQVKAILQSSTISTKKDMQCFTGRLAALGRFISLFTDKIRLFFTTLHGA